MIFSLSTKLSLSRQSQNMKINMSFALYTKQLYRLYEPAQITHIMSTPTFSIYMSPGVRKPTFCICENTDADQLRGNREADQRLCFRYLDSTILLLPKSKISNIYPSPVAVQPGFCQNWSESTLLVFSRRGSYAKDRLAALPRRLISAFAFRCLDSIHSRAFGKPKYQALCCTYRFVSYLGGIPKIGFLS